MVQPTNYLDFSLPMHWEVETNQQARMLREERLDLFCQISFHLGVTVNMVAAKTMVRSVFPLLKLHSKSATKVREFSTVCCLKYLTMPQGQWSPLPQIHFQPASQPACPNSAKFDSLQTLNSITYTEISKFQQARPFLNFRRNLE